MNGFGIRKETPHHISFNGGGAQNTASTTAYSPIGGTTNFNPTERNRQVLIARNCIVKNLYIATGSTQPATGTMVFTLRKNGVDTSLVVTIAANAVAGGYADNIDEVTFSAGDLLSLKSVNNATGTSAELTSWSILTV